MDPHVILEGAGQPPCLYVLPKWQAMNMLVGGLTGANTRKQAMKDGLIHPTPHTSLIEPRSPCEGVGICEQLAGRGDMNEPIAAHLYYSLGLEQAQ